MSLGIDFERYQFDRRLKDLQDKILSLNYRAPQEQVPQVLPVSEPQYLNNQYYPKPIYYSPQLLYQYSPNQNAYIPYFQYQIDNQSLKKEKEEKLEKRRMKELERKNEIQKVQENLSKQQELMMASLKKDILDYIDPFIYGNYRNNQYYIPQYQQQYQNLNPQILNQVPLYIQGNNSQQVFPEDNLRKSQSQRTSFQQVGQNSLNQFDHVLARI